MGKSLVIVESPAKAKTINKYLGSHYVVKSSVGHIRDLPKSGSNNKKNASEIIKKQKTEKKMFQDHQSSLIKRMGIDPYHGWKAQYEILSGKEKVVSELKALAAKADHIYLATDLDREGEAIAWHLREVIGGDPQRFSRVIFNEITQNAIQQAFKKPGELNMNRIHAQQARRFMDRVVGYMVSPLLWKKIARGLSAGRVQSVAVRLVVEREREIKAFVPQEYWHLEANLLTPQKIMIPMMVSHFEGEPFKPLNREQTYAAVNDLEDAQYVVLDRKDKPTSSKAGAPFITSTLQQAASTRLGFGVKKTMLMAQRLYEAGHITYMRTDSTHLSQDALSMVRNYIQKHFGNRYLISPAYEYGNKKNAQEAHEAIRPSNVDVFSEQLEDMEPDARKLYQLIWRQFVACQMTPAQYDVTTLIVEAKNYQLRAKGRTLRFDGWTKVMPALRKGDEEETLPIIAVGTSMHLEKLIPSQHFTKPPGRYSEASLVKELEKRSIGRPSTYATIISTVQERGYVRIENRRFYAEKMGEIVTNRLEENFRELMNYDFTARMENALDQIAQHQAEWKKVLDEFFSEFSEQLNIAEKDPSEGGMRPNSMVIMDINCPACGQKMGIRTASTGVFLGCSSYALPPKERCKTTLNLISENEILNLLDGDEAETNALRSRRRCEKCETAMDSYLLDTARKLHICGNNPICDGYQMEQGEFRIKGYEGPIVECDKCAHEMHLKVGRFGKYMGCTNEECKNTRKILRNGEVAPPKENPVPLPELLCEKSDAYFVLRDGAAGLFLAANTFPRSRETRAPRVEELQRFKDRLPEKWHYLVEAPLKDTEGNKTFLRFSRKTKEQYISSEKSGKATGWCAFYIDGQWVEGKKRPLVKS
ncbi:DNA topoisomerase I [Candidatus Williamhamiltonella defendens]|uniref:DNA topoisomerase 1 n=1 Tax=Hamiltonella defensa subsp. Acyrthosiphon pisum (strain 5AT) TaxID=572265 RepID=C4K720_HAMD5|nr:type I DNA topoisomerase [Candidatus Hamiltonella defensa]ACQ68363.1 DNA topoisomerase type I, omega protein [Candidatus Hamiltonella defensa 5AT (Acyrthosiphon pisum)]ATW22919.1 DNA topoisomerase I [Candidatus Hamiltonella defensa]